MNINLSIYKIILLFFFFALFKIILNLRISHVLSRGSQVPEFLISYEYIRILKYFMYISNKKKTITFINYFTSYINEGVI